MAKDYYRVLGIGREASGQEIKKAYRCLALRYHPDVNAGDPLAEEHFKELTEAYGVLIDPSKRQAYDRDRSRVFDRSRVYQDIFSHSEYQEVFNELPIKGEWLERLLNIGKIFAYEALIYGGRPRDVLRRGLVRIAVQGAGSMFHNVMDIREEIHVPPEIADKGGYITLEYRPGFQTKRIRVHIPRHLRSGTILRIKGMGRRNLKKNAGDLYLLVRIDSS